MALERNSGNLYRLTRVVRPLVEANVSPHYFQELTQSDPLLVEAIVMCIVGFVLIYGIEFIGKKMQKQQ